MRFYTNFYSRGNSVIIRGYDNGRRFVDKVSYKPTLFVPSNEDSVWSTIHMDSVKPINFSSIREAKDFIDRYEDVENFTVYGSTSFDYVCVHERFENDFDIDHVRIGYIDIEVGSEQGFPEPELANQPVTAITIAYQGNYYVLGVGDFVTEDKRVKYIDCKSEDRLLMNFLDIWERLDLDIVSGWNVEGFDIPYLHNRINKVLGEDMVNRLSPQRIIYERKIFKHNKQTIQYNLVGTSVLDYLELYKKFTYTQQESYRLDHIANVELGARKLDYSEVETLHQLYKTDYQKFIEYNIKDVELIEQLEDKMRLIEQALTIAYDAKVNYNDVFTQVRMWDVLIHNYLYNQRVVIPPKKTTKKDAQYAGAYVKDPQVGMHDWVLSFDLNSLYPHLIMQYNISPDTFEETLYSSITVDDILNGKTDTKIGVALAANGRYYNTNKQGFLPKMMERMYNERKGYKKKMLEAQTELEKIEKMLKELDD